MQEVDILQRLDKIEHQLKFFADTYKTLHNILINGIHIKLEKELLEPSLSRITEKVYEFRQLQTEISNLIKNDSIIGTLSFMGKRIHEMESSIREMKETGIKKKIHLDFTLDGYEMVKKQPLIKDIIPKEEITPEDALVNLLKTITPKESEIISHRYGLFGFGEKTLARVGKLLNLSADRIRQIQSKALRKMRHPSRRKFVEVLTHKELREDILGVKE